MDSDNSKSPEDKERERRALLTLAAKHINDWMERGWPALYKVACDKVKITKLMANLQVKIEDS